MPQIIKKRGHDTGDHVDADRDRRAAGAHGFELLLLLHLPCVLTVTETSIRVGFFLSVCPSVCAYVTLQERLSAWMASHVLATSRRCAKASVSGTCEGLGTIRSQHTQTVTLFVTAQLGALTCLAANAVNAFPRAERVGVKSGHVRRQILQKLLYVLLRPCICHALAHFMGLTLRHEERERGEGTGGQLQRRCFEKPSKNWGTVLAKKK